MFLRIPKPEVLDIRGTKLSAGEVQKLRGKKSSTKINIETRT